MKTRLVRLAFSTLSVLAFASCQESKQQSPQPLPNPQTTLPQNSYNPTLNQPPLVGAVSAVTIVAGQTLTGVLTADDPDRPQGDTITRIEFSTSPEVPGLSYIQVPVGSGDRHNYSLLTPTTPNMPSTVGTFTVYDSRGASTRTAFPITFQGANGFTPPGGTTGTTAYCAALSEALKLNGIWGVALPLICNSFGPKL